MWGISKRYLHNDEYSSLETQLTRKSGLKNWQDHDLKIYPHQAKAADLAIRDYEIALNNDLRADVQNTMREVLNEFEDSDYRNRIANVQSFKELNFNSNYRVLEMGNPLNTARTSFFHKSVGGYSAVKVKRVQEVIDFYFQNEYNTLNQALENNDFDLLKQNHFFNMINTKYYIFNIDGNGIIDFKTQNNKKPGVLKNPYALGNAWTVSDVRWVSNSDEEILFLNNSLFDPSKIAVIDNKKVSINISSYDDLKSYLKKQIAIL